MSYYPKGMHCPCGNTVFHPVGFRNRFIGPTDIGEALWQCAECGYTNTSDFMIFYHSVENTQMSSTIQVIRNLLNASKGRNILTEEEVRVLKQLVNKEEEAEKTIFSKTTAGPVSVEFRQPFSLENELLHILSKYCGEAGESEGAVETLKRKFHELHIIAAKLNLLRTCSATRDIQQAFSQEEWKAVEINKVSR